SAETPAASRPIPTTLWTRAILRNEVEAISDPTPAEIITIKVISGFASTRKGLMLRVSDFSMCVSAVLRALDVKISLLALMRFTSEPGQFDLTLSFGSALLFAQLELRRGPALLPACAASA